MMMPDIRALIAATQGSVDILLRKVRNYSSGHCPECSRH